MNSTTMFIDAPTTKEKYFGSSMIIVNGDQLARDINAAVAEKENEGFELLSAVPIHSSKQLMGSFAYGLTSGVLLTFKKKNT